MSGVRSSWLTLAMNSVFIWSISRSRRMSRSTKTAPVSTPPASRNGPAETATGTTVRVAPEIGGQAPVVDHRAHEALRQVDVVLAT